MAGDFQRPAEDWKDDMGKIICTTCGRRGDYGSFTGQLGNVLLELAITFAQAEKEGIPRDCVIFRRSYDVWRAKRRYRQPALPIHKVNYIELNREILTPIYNHFLSAGEFNRRIGDCDELVGVYLKPTKSVFAKTRPGFLTELFYDELSFSGVRSGFTDYYNENYAALHVRRTDFAVWRNGSHLLSKDDIQSTIDGISAGHPAIVVFSDDIGWCAENLRRNDGGALIFHNSTPVDPPCHDLILMSCFKNIYYNEYSTYGTFAKKMSDDLRLCNKMNWLWT